MIKDSDISEILQRLMTSTGLSLRFEKNESGFSLLHMDGDIQQAYGILIYHDG